LLVQAGNFATSQDFLWGGGARLQYLGWAPWRLALDVQTGTFGRDTPLGKARLLSGSVGIRGGYSVGDGRRLSLTAGAGVRVGLARASANAASDAGSSVQSASVTGAWTAPLVFAAFDTSLLGQLRLGLDAEVGAVVLPVRGRIERGDDIEVRGLWAALSLLLGIQF
jgi:hypothetical protein